MNQQEIEELIAAAPESALFASLDRSAAQSLVEQANRRSLKRGESLFQQGDEGGFTGLILSGVAKIHTFTESGREVVYAYLSKGELCGEISALDGSPRTASATMMEKSEIAIIPRDTLMSVISKNPALGIKIIESLCARLRATDKMMESDRSAATGPRLARGLLRLLKEHNETGARRDQVAFKISQGDLGAFVSLSRENVNRQLQDWTREGLVEMNAGRITILDHTALNDVAAFDT